MSILTGIAHSALPKAAQIEQKQALIIQALKNKNSINCPVVIKNTNELQQLTNKIPTVLYYYRGRCYSSAGNQKKALQDLDDYFSRNKKKDTVYQKAMVLYSGIEERVKLDEIAEVKRLEKVALDKKMAAKAASLAKKEKAQYIVQLNKNNIVRLDNFHRGEAKLIKKYRKYRIENCKTFKTAKSALSEYSRFCRGECKKEKRYWERKLDKQDREVKSLGGKLDYLRDNYDDKQKNVQNKGGKYLTRRGKKNPYIDDDWKRPSCSSMVYGALLSW